MIASWMLYCALCAVGLSAAATLAERALLAARGPVRAVWFGAVLLSLAIPAVALTNHSRSGALPAKQATTAIGAPSASIIAGVPSASRNGVPLTRAPGFIASPSSRLTQVVESIDGAWARWSAVLLHADRALAYLWLALSAMLGLYFVGGVGALALMRRSWRRDIVLDVPVFVSGATGPALVGMLSPAIVVPEWALAMDASQLGLMLRHEEEHRRARDSQLLTLAHIALVVMPWNVALWWQIRRLRAAVEMDCDARVLLHADVRSYGDLLLEVVRPGRGLRLMGATAFAERATQLERRIRVMATGRHRASHVSHAARVIALSIALLTLSVAWVAPRPAAPVIATAWSRHGVPVSGAKSMAASLRVDAAAATRPASPERGVAVAAVLGRAAPTPPRNSADDYAAAARSALVADEFVSLRRFGTSGVINPMLMLLRQSESLGLTAQQADSIATLNRRYMVALSGVWSPVIRRYVAAASSDDGKRDAILGSAAAASMQALIELSPRIEALLTPSQRRALPPAIAADLDVARLTAIGASDPAAGGVFAPNGGLGSGPGGRGRIGGPGR